MFPEALVIPGLPEADAVCEMHGYGQPTGIRFGEGERMAGQK